MSLVDLFFGNLVDQKPEYEENTLTVNSENDGTAEVETSYGLNGGINRVDFSLAELPTAEQDTIREYRKLAMNAEVDEAITEIVNESFNITQDRKAIDLSFNEETKLSEKIQELILNEYHKVYHDLFDFDRQGAYLFRKFYVDSRLFIHKVVDPKKGEIVKLQVIEPLQIRRIRFSEVKNPHTGIIDLSKQEIRYYYTPKIKDISMLWGGNASNFEIKSNVFLQFSEQSIAYIDSGLVHPDNGFIIGHLAKAIIPFNNMKMMEDSLVIYRVVRSPARRVFYVDVGNMPKSKGESFLQQMMQRFKNRLTYDPKTGGMIDRKNVMSMLEDIWLPRSNGRSTEVSMLDEGRQLGEVDDVEYTKNTFYRSLNVPRSRFDDNASNPFNAGRHVDVSRDELRFLKLVQSLRNRFISIIEDVLRTQLQLKNIIKTNAEWQEVRRSFSWVFAEDNQFTELKELEILSNRLNLLRDLEQYEDKYFTRDWILKHILRYNDVQIKELEKANEERKKNEDEDLDDE